MGPAFVPSFSFTKSNQSSQRYCNRYPTNRLSPIMSVQDNEKNKKGILMLCLGNICRSPAAEAVMKGVIKSRDLQDDLFVDSCGTGGGSPNWYMEGGFSYHRGDNADSRMTQAANKRGLNVDSVSRPLCPEDFDKFDIIIAMDSNNIESIETARKHWGVNQPHAEIALMSEFSSDKNFRGQAVPDPYYSGADGFEYALDLIQDACDGLADHMTKDLPKTAS